MSDRYFRLRAELWYRAREWFETRDKVLPSTLEHVVQFIDEMAAVEVKMLSSGKTDIESKRDMKTRGLKSPNLADSFVLTFMDEGAISTGNFTANAGWGKVNTRAARAPGF